EAVGLDLLGGRRTGLQADADLLDAGLLEVQRVRATLGAVADDGDLLALDEIEIGIAIVVNTHGLSFPGCSVRATGFPDARAHRKERRTDRPRALHHARWPQPTASGHRPEAAGSARRGRRARKRCGTPPRRPRRRECRPPCPLRAAASCALRWRSAHWQARWRP